MICRKIVKRKGSRSDLGVPLLSNKDWRRLRAWHTKHGRRLSWRDGATPWSILLVETLLHRTGASVAQSLYPLARNAFPSPESIILKKDHWTRMLKRAGLFWRARIFVSACKVLMLRYGGCVPSDRKELESLPGVGHYTASAVRCFGFGLREFITDTNTIRVAGRLAGKNFDPANHRSKTIQALTARLSNNGRAPLARDNYALLDLAAIVCRPKIPLCHKCPLRMSCRTADIRAGRRTLQQ